MKRTLPNAILVFGLLLVLVLAACSTPAGGRMEPVPTEALAPTGALAPTKALAPTLPLAEPTAVLAYATEAAPSTALKTEAVETQIAAMLTQAASAEADASATQIAAMMTEAAAPTVTAIAPPTFAPTASPTPAAGVKLPEGWVVYRHTQMPGFAFPADPARWKLQGEPRWPWSFLEHTQLPDCRINPPPLRDLVTPPRMQYWKLGRLSWRVFDYGDIGFATIHKPSLVSLDLHSMENPRCLSDIQEVLEWVLLEDELSGRSAYDPLPTPTARAPIPGFLCPNTPPARLRVGDFPHIVTNDLLLRSEPRADPGTRIRAYDATDPVVVKVIGGPVCTEKFVYWNVSIQIFSDQYIPPKEGWMAEGDLNEYYLEPEG